MVATVNVARTQMEWFETKFWLDQVILLLPLFIILPRFMTFCLQLKKYIPNTENVRYIYYNKLTANQKMSNFI